MDYLIGGAVVALFWMINVVVLKNNLRLRLAGFTSHAMRVLTQDKDHKAVSFLLLCIAEQAIFKSSKALETVVKQPELSEELRESYAMQASLEEVVYKATTRSILSLKGGE